MTQKKWILINVGRGQGWGNSGIAFIEEWFMWELISGLGCKESCSPCNREPSLTSKLYNYIISLSIMANIYLLHLSGHFTYIPSKVGSCLISP